MSEYKIQNIELIETEMQKHQLDEPTLIKYINQYMKHRISLKNAKNRYAKSKKGLEKTRFSAKKHYWTKKIKRYHVLYNPDPLLKAKEEEEEELQLLSQ
tara:strand:+ start:3836 stop:4132 length:297 start_codon:yes stop_codon:yes gene_type:complete